MSARRAGFIILLLATAYHAPTPAVAQANNDLDCAIAAANQPDLTAIETFVDAQEARIFGPDPAQQEAARTALLEPLACNNVSLEFRFRYGSIIRPLLERLLEQGSEQQAVIGLELAGQIGTLTTVELVERALEDDRPVIRAAAARAARNTLATYVSTGAGLPDDAAAELLTNIGLALVQEQNPLVAGRLVDALQTASSRGPAARAAATQLAGSLAQCLRDRPAIFLDGAAALAAEQPSPWLLVALRGARALRDALLDPSLVDHFSDDDLKTLAAAGGQLLALARDYLTTRGLPAADSINDRALQQIIGFAGNLLFTADLRLGIPQRTANLSQAYHRARQTGDINQLLAPINEWIGKAGYLMQPPYAMNLADFAEDGQ